MSWQDFALTDMTIFRGPDRGSRIVLVPTVGWSDARETGFANRAYAAGAIKVSGGIAHLAAQFAYEDLAAAKRFAADERARGGKARVHSYPPT